MHSDDLPLRDALKTALKSNHIDTLTPIQVASLPITLEQRDVLGLAQTGSGKTLCYVLPILQQLAAKEFTTQALILCPTRELAAQVAQQCRTYAAAIGNVKVLELCGGISVGKDIQSLKHGCHIVVGTPGRIEEHIVKRRLDLSAIKVRVLDEADRMLDMGFADSVEFIFSHTPASVQTLLFSATFPQSLSDIANRFQHNPARIEVHNEQAKPNIKQIVYEVLPHARPQALKSVLTHYQPETAIVFCNTKKEVAEVVDDLRQDGFIAASLSGDMEQAARNQVITRFAIKALPVLVATDVAARGLDIDDVDCVINYRVSEDADTHVHRIGRTARAGASGIAVTLMSSDEEKFLAAVENHTETRLTRKGAQSLRYHKNRIGEPLFYALVVNGGKRQKLRPGDILGALTQQAEIPADDVGKIAVKSSETLVAIKLRSVKRALAYFREGRIKGKKFKARKLL